MADRALHQSNLLRIRLGSTVPRLVEIRNGRAIARGFAGKTRQPGAIVRQRADRVEDRAARRGESRSDHRRDLTVEIVDTRIRMPVQGALAEPRSFDRVLTHELAHAMIAGVARRGVPAWLHEGLAQYFEPGDVPGAEQRWRAARTLIPLDQLQDGFARFDSREARVAYDQSLVAASVLMAHLGPNIALLLHDLDTGNELPLALTRLGFQYADFEGELARRLK